jgi:hypothetical protein
MTIAHINVKKYMEISSIVMIANAVKSSLPTNLTALLGRSGFTPKVETSTRKTRAIEYVIREADFLAAITHEKTIITDLDKCLYKYYHDVTIPARLVPGIVRVRGILECLEEWEDFDPDTDEAEPSQGFSEVIASLKKIFDKQRQRNVDIYAGGCTLTRVETQEGKKRRRRSWLRLELKRLGSRTRMICLNV